LENSNKVVSISCKDCDVWGYIENIAPTEVSYCPKCGSENISIFEGKVQHK
jgi:Zn finger protein HypA/HybF involved in hydrogenase expression